MSTPRQHITPLHPSPNPSRKRQRRCFRPSGAKAIKAAQNAATKRQEHDAKVDFDERQIETAAEEEKIDSKVDEVVVKGIEEEKPTHKPQSRRNSLKVGTAVNVGSSRPQYLPEEQASRSIGKESGIRVKEEDRVVDGKQGLVSFCQRIEVQNKKTQHAETVPTKSGVTRENTVSQTKQEETSAGPKVRIVDGEIVLQESSMVVNGPTNQADDELPVVEEETQLAIVGASYSSFAERTKPTRWTTQETAKFYNGLRQLGTDFGAMEVLFDNKRTRKQLKKKFKLEQSRNPSLVEKALNPKYRLQIGE